ncbi:MAG: T9SS type A sorting domain-containing protein [Flavobacteriales bacterium]|nr:T9SS type A sorting domain-containing protein [Flavobacteriales bacterium]
MKTIYLQRFCLLLIMISVVPKLQAQLSDPSLLFVQRSADYWTDMDGDGDIDILNIHYGVWTERNENGEYLLQHVFNMSVIDQLHDMDEDGDIDGIGKQFNDDVIWFENTGDGGMWTEHFLGNWPGSNTFFDYNMDGHDDIINLGESEIFYVRYAAGDGSFGAQEEITVSNAHVFYPNAYSTALGYLSSVYGDLDGDGFDDIVSSYCAVSGCNDGTYHIFRFSSLGYAEIQSPGLVAYTVLDIDDINNDGINELLTYNFSSTSVGVMYDPLSSDYVTTTPVSGLEAMMSELRLEDFNGDGMNDVLTYNYPEYLSGIRYGNGDGSFQTQQDLPVNLTYGFLPSLAFPDIDQDGDLDIGEGERYFLNDGTGHFDLPFDFDVVFGQYQSFSNVDFDPQIEFLSLDNNVVDFNANGEIVVITEQNIADGIAPYWYLKVQDINGDQCDDIVMIETTTVRILICTESGLLEIPSIDLSVYMTGAYSGNSTYYDVYDMDMDGNDDLLIFDTGFPFGMLQLSIHPDLTNSVITDYPFLEQIMATPYLADIDMDGDFDVSLFEDYLNYYRNEGDGTLTQVPFEYPEQSMLFNIGNIDLNGDGILDSFDGYTFLEFDGYGGMDSHVFPFPISFQDHNYLFADFNADNLPDILVFLYYPYSLTPDFDYKIYINQGNFNFVETQSVTIPGMMLNSVQAVDVDGDGYLDVVGLAEAAQITRGWFWLKNNWNTYHIIAGHVFVDENSNGLWDAGETGIDKSNVMLNPEGSIQFATNLYYFPVDAGNHQVEINYDEDVWTPTTPVLYDVIVEADSPTSLNNDFGFVPTNPLGTVFPSVNAGFAVCGGTQVYNIQVMCVTESTGPLSVNVNLDPALAYLDGSVPFTEGDGNNLTWLFPAQPYGSTLSFQIYVQYPDVSSMGSTLITEVNACIYDELGNESVCESVNWNEVQTCYYDPNMKEVSPAGSGQAGLMFNGTDLTYTIHFQNTGSAPAQTVVVEDQLSEYLDPSTMQILSWSHPVVSTVENGLIRFEFEEIMLPDSLSDPAGSQGYVTYKISPYADLPVGTAIDNTANIYFDLNEAVVTNTTLNTIFECNGVVEGGNLVSDCDAESMTIDPLISDALSYQWLVDGEPFSTDPVLNLPLNAGDSYDVVLQFTNELCESSIHYLVTAPLIPEATISYGPEWGYIQTFVAPNATIEWYYLGELLPDETDSTLYIGIEMGGDFTVVITTPDGCSNSYTGDFVYENVDEHTIINLVTFPTPVHDFLTYSSNVIIEEMKLTDLTGQVISTYSLISKNGRVDLSPFASGIYLIEFSTENGFRETRTIVKNK